MEIKILDVFKEENAIFFKVFHIKLIILYFDREIFFPVIGSRWPSNEALTFRIVKYPTTFPQQFVDTELTKALKVYLLCFLFQSISFFVSFSYGVVHQVLNLNIEN